MQVVIDKVQSGNQQLQSAHIVFWIYSFDHHLINHKALAYALNGSLIDPDKMQIVTD